MYTKFASLHTGRPTSLQPNVVHRHTVDLTPQLDITPACNLLHYTRALHHTPICKSLHPKTHSLYFSAHVYSPPGCCEVLWFVVFFNENLDL